MLRDALRDIRTDNIVLDGISSANTLQYLLYLI